MNPTIIPPPFPGVKLRYILFGYQASLYGITAFPVYRPLQMY